MDKWSNELEVQEDQPIQLNEDSLYPDTTTDSYGIFENQTQGNQTYDDYWDPWHPPYAVRTYRTVYSYMAIYMTFVFMGGFFLNALVLYTAYRNRVVRTPLNYIVINLTAADLIAAILGDVISIMANAAGRFFLGKIMCTTEGFTVSVAGIAGLMSVAVMAFERYFVVCKPFGPVRFTENMAIAGIAFTWVWSLFWHLPMLTMWNGFEAEGFGTNCGPNYWVTAPNERTFLVFYFLFCFIFPFATIFLAYGKLISSLRQMKKESMVTSSSNVSADEEVTRMVVVMVTAFTVCWSPYAIVSMINVFRTNKIYWLGAIPAFFAKSAAVYNPLIYIGLNRQFRDCTLKTIFGRNPFSDEQMVTSSTASTVTTVSTSKVAPA